MNKEILKAIMVVFIASFCTMVIELVAGRIMAPYIGVSLYTWTSIIGVVLAGISIGAYLGGILADRFPTTRTLGWLLFFSGIGALAIAPLTNAVARWPLPTSFMVRILCVTAVIFFFPSCILGMVSPVAVRLSLNRLDRSGTAVGKIYAFSTLGSILGTFLTGFFLISWIGTRNILLLMASILIVSAPLFGGAFLKRRILFILFPALFIFLWAIYGQVFQKYQDSDSYYYKETNYYTIQLKKTEKGERLLEAVVLDNLVHSFVNLENPFDLEYGYERVYAALVDWKAPSNRDLRVLSIGGGGYVFPRYLEAKYPKARIEVIEIDPQVTATAQKYLSLSSSSRIRTFNQDARWFLMNFKERGVYDLVLIDAFNDLSVPYHLTTKEFSSKIHSLLKPDGLLLVNIIDNFKKGLFLPSYVRTLKEVFGGEKVCLAAEEDFSDMETNTIIVAASPGNNPWEAMAKDLAGRCSLLTPVEINQELNLRRAFLLTDDYAPVDNLIAPIFEERFGIKRNRG